MKRSLRAYLADLRSFPQNLHRNPQRYFPRPGKDFTRRRVIYLERLVFMVLSLLKKSLGNELDTFFALVDDKVKVPTQSALVQARNKLKPAVFEDLFAHTVNKFYEHFKAKRWKGLLFWACDGTGFKLPEEYELGEEFGWHSNQNKTVVSTRLLVFFDLLNKIVTRRKSINQTFLKQRLRVILYQL